MTCIRIEYQGKNEQDQRDKIVELLGTPDEDNWPNFNLLSGAKHVRYKKKQSVLREKIPLYSYTGDPTLSDRGYELLKVQCVAVCCSVLQCVAVCDRGHIHELSAFCVYTCVCVWVWMSVSMSVLVLASVWVWVCDCGCECLCDCLSVCLRVCVCVCV